MKINSDRISISACTVGIVPMERVVRIIAVFMKLTEPKPTVLSQNRV